MSEDLPVFAVGNSEPLPEEMPEHLKAILRGFREVAGWCDHGQRLGECSSGC